jgi:plastocyanin
MYKISSSILFLMLLVTSSSSVIAANPVHERTVALQGTITFTGESKSASERDYADTVVFFQPDTPVTIRPMNGDITMATKGYEFVPHVLAVTAGTKVRFPNFDTIFHNVFSSSAPNNFDLGLYGRNPGKSVTFEHQGLVRVYCNVHHYMFAYILVLETPYFTKVGDQGGFALRDLPAGPGTLTIYNPQTKVWRQHVDTLQQHELDVSLEVIAHGIPEHSNKDGQSYSQHHGGV